MPLSDRHRRPAPPPIRPARGRRFSSGLSPDVALTTFTAVLIDTLGRAPDLFQPSWDGPRIDDPELIVGARTEDGPCCYAVFWPRRTGSEVFLVLPGTVPLPGLVAAWRDRDPTLVTTGVIKAA